MKYFRYQVKPAIAVNSIFPPDQIQTRSTHREIYTAREAIRNFHPQPYCIWDRKENKFYDFRGVEIKRKSEPMAAAGGLPTGDKE